MKTGKTVELGAALRKLRNDRGLSKAEVARSSGLSANQVAAIEQGNGCNIKSAFAYFDAVGLDFIGLLNGGAVSEPAVVVSDLEWSVVGENDVVATGLADVIGAGPWSFARESSGMALRYFVAGDGRWWAVNSMRMAVGSGAGGVEGLEAWRVGYLGERR